jgi:hypothetical protein
MRSEVLPGDRPVFVGVCGFDDEAAVGGELECARQIFAY